MPPVTATPISSFSPRSSAAVEYQAGGALGGTPGAARRGPLMASSIAEVEPLRVLVVEPDARARSLLEVGLARAGFEVQVAGTLAEAHDQLGLGRPLPAMLVCETDLAGEDGFRFCSQLRADLRTAQMPVVLLSQRPEAFHLEMASGAGADDYLPKPIFLNDVVSLAKLKAGQSAAQAVFPADTRALPIGELLRALLAGMRSGHLELEDGSARLTFRQGQVVDAEVEGVRGARALSRLLVLARGAYAVTFGPALARGTLAVDLRELCRSVLPDVARSRRALERALPLEAVLRIDVARLREVLPDLPDGVNALVRLIDGQRTLRQVILKCELPEASALLVTTRLYGLGAVGPVADDFAASLEEALAAAAESGSEPAARPEPGELAAALRAPEGEKSFTSGQSPALVGTAEAIAGRDLRAQKLDDLDERLEEALQHAAEVAARAALLPRPVQIVDVHYFTPRSTPPRSHPQSLIATDRTGARTPARPWWRSAQARVLAGALALFVGSAALGSVLFRPVPVSGQAPAAAPRFAGLPEWLTPGARGTAESWTTIGLRRYDNGDLEGAEAATAHALALDARNGRALLLLATVQYGLGQPAEAKAALRRYLAAYPDGEFAAEARALLER